MKMFTLAIRSLNRNRRRSIVTLLTIAIGFSAIALFAGYIHNIYEGLTRQSIHGELLGHLTLSKRGMSVEGKLNPEKYLLTASDVINLNSMLKANSQIKLITPRLSLSGILTNGRASTIFIADGIDPEAINILQEGFQTELEKQIGFGNDYLKQLDAQHPDKALFSKGLIPLMQLKLGMQIPLLVNTVYGQANALDATVNGFFNTGNAGTNDKFAILPLKLAQTLYDLEGGADRLTLLLHNEADTEMMRTNLLKQALAIGYDLEIKTWKELSDFYNQVYAMFNIIFGFIFSIVLTVVVMSVANSMAMSVVERTREIGTLRAIGLKRSGVIKLFVTESLLLTSIGCVFGLIITLIIRWCVNMARISYIPPNSPDAVPLLVDLDIERITLTAIMLLLVGTLAAYLPARKAAHQPIIDSLGHV
jgi:putative ABC transport system permease protein